MRITSTGSASAGMFAQPVHAQTSATAILELDIENIVNYVADASDVPKFATKLTSASAQVAALVWGKCLVGVQDPEASPEDKCQDPNLAPARDPAWALAWVEGMEFGEMS